MVRGGGGGEFSFFDNCKIVCMWGWGGGGGSLTVSECGDREEQLTLLCF